MPYNAFDIAYYQVCESLWNRPPSSCFVQGYFDVDTNTVLKRVGIAMISPDRTSLPKHATDRSTCTVSDARESGTDDQDRFGLYQLSCSPCTSRRHSAPQSRTTSLTVHIHRLGLPLLSTAVTLLYAYGLAVPALLWAATKWLGMEGWAMTESLAIYGYAMSVFVPISLLCLIRSASFAGSWLV